MRYPDAFDWHGCETVRFKPDKLIGGATVGETRMDADGIFLNFEDGRIGQRCDPKDPDAIREILEFARARGYRAEA